MRENLSSAEDPFAYLKYFDTAFLIDDSDSMVRHWGKVEAVLEEIAGVCVKHDANGVDVYFINHRPHGSFFTGNYGYKNIGATEGNPAFHDSITGIFGHVRPRGKCRLDHALRHVLDPYLLDLSATFHLSGRRRWLRPLNLIVITAGHAYDNPYNSLMHFARRLDELGAPPYQVGIQLFQVGDNSTVREALEFADEGLHREAGIRDMVDTVTRTGRPGELSAETVLKVVLGSVRKSVDRLET